MRTRKNSGIIGPVTQSGPGRRSGVFSYDDITLGKQNEIYSAQEGAQTSNTWDINGDVDPYYNQVGVHFGDVEMTNHIMKDQTGSFIDDFISPFKYDGDNLAVSYYGPAYPDWSTEFIDDSYLQIQENADASAFLDNPFTIDFWIKPQRQDATQRYLMGRGNQAGVTAGTGWVVGLNSSYQPFFYDAVANATLTSSAALPRDQWSFVSICRNSQASNDFRIYVNGVLQATGTCASLFQDSGATLLIGIDRQATTGATSAQSRMTDIRIVKSSIYGSTSSFVTPTTALSMTNTNLVYGMSMTNPSYDNVMGQVNSSTFTASPFTTSSYSVYFNSTSTSYYLYPNVVNNFGTSNFTVEMWINYTFTATNQTCLFYCGNGTGANPKVYMYLTTGSQIAAGITLNGSTDTLVPTPSGMVRNQWYHIALVRYNSNLTLYVNGNPISSTANSTNLSGITSSYTYIGSGAPVDSGYPGYFRGWISNFRINNLTGVYTGAFTPPTSPLTTLQPAGTTNIQAITAGTTLLCCQNIGFFDNSGTARNINQSGPPQIWAKNPFVTMGTALRNIWNNGGNNMGRKNDGPFYQPLDRLPRGPGYHSLSGQDNVAHFHVYDYKNTLTSGGKSLALNASAFTVEAWINPAYQSNSGSYPVPIVARGSSNTGLGGTGINGWGLYLYNGYLRWDDGANTFQYQSDLQTQGASTYPTRCELGAWYHVAAVRQNLNPGGFALYVNGVQVSSSTWQLTSVYNDQSPLSVLGSRGVPNTGNLYNNAAYRAFVTGVRISNVARYTGNFTFNNTSLLAYSHAIDTATMYLSCTTLNDEPRMPWNSWKDWGIGPYSQQAAIFRQGTEIRQGASAPLNRGRTGSWQFLGNSYNRLQGFVNTQQGNPTSEFNFGTGDFSIEMWHNDLYTFNDIGGGITYLFDSRYVWQDQGISLRRSGINRLDVVSNNLVVFSDNTHRFQTGVWRHIVVQRVNGATALYINGIKLQENMLLNGLTVQAGIPSGTTGYYAFNLGNSSYPNLQYGNAGNGILLTDVRIYKNVGAYGNYLTNTGQLTTGTNPPIIPVPTAPLPAGPTYATYFASTGSYLYATTSTFNINNTQPWTVEMFVYPLASTTATSIFSIGNGVAYSNIINIQWTNTGSFVFNQGQAAGIGTYNQIQANGFNTSTWYHVSVTKDASYNIRMFINGTQYGSTINSSIGLYTTTSNFTGVINGTYDNLGLGANSQPIIISNLRWFNGSALYTGNFTPPATGLTRFSNNSIANGSLTVGLGLIACNTNVITSDISGQNILLQAGGTAMPVPIANDPTATRWTPFVGDGNCVFLLNAPMQLDNSGRNNCIEWPWQELSTEGNCTGENVSMMSPYSGSQFPWPSNTVSPSGQIGYVSGTVNSWTSVVYNLQATNSFAPGAIITATSVIGSLGTGTNYVANVIDNTSVIVLSTGTQAPVAGQLGPVGTTDESSRFRAMNADNGSNTSNGFYSHSTFGNNSQLPELSWITRLNIPWTIEFFFYPYWEDPQGTPSGYWLYWNGQVSAGGYECFSIMFDINAATTGASGLGWGCMDFRWNLEGPSTLTFLTGVTNKSTGGPPSINNPIFKQQSWMHAAIVYDPTSSTKMAMFWNGVRVATGSLTAGTRNHAYTVFQSASGNNNCGPIRISNTVRYPTTAATVNAPWSGWVWDRYTAVLIDQDLVMNDRTRNAHNFFYGIYPSYRFKQWPQSNASMVFNQQEAIYSTWVGGTAIGPHRIDGNLSTQNFGSPGGVALSSRRGDWTLEMWAAWWDPAAGGMNYRQNSPRSDMANTLMHLSNNIWIGVSSTGKWGCYWANGTNTDPESWTTYSTVTTTISVATATGITLGTNSLGKSMDHIVIMSRNENISFFVNGIEQGTLRTGEFGTYANAVGPQNSFSLDWNGSNGATAWNYRIGCDYYGTTSTAWNGFIQDFRVSRLARYTTRVINSQSVMCYPGTNIPALPTGPFPTK